MLTLITSEQLCATNLSIRDEGFNQHLSLLHLPHYDDPPCDVVSTLIFSELNDAFNKTTDYAVPGFDVNETTLVGITIRIGDELCTELFLLWTQITTYCTDYLLQQLPCCDLCVELRQLISLGRQQQHNRQWTIKYIFGYRISYFPSLTPQCYLDIKDHVTPMQYIYTPLLHQ